MNDERRKCSLGPYLQIYGIKPSIKFEPFDVDID